MFFEGRYIGAEYTNKQQFHFCDAVRWVADLLIVQMHVVGCIELVITQLLSKEDRKDKKSLVDLDATAAVAFFIGSTTPLLLSTSKKTKSTFNFLLLNTTCAGRCLR